MYRLPDMMTLAGRKVRPETITAAVVGLVLPLIAKRQSPTKRNFGWHLDRVVAAVAAGQLTVFFDRFGEISGYVLWGMVHPQQEPLLLKNGPEILNVCELTGQGNPWILDFQTMNGALPNILLELRDVEYLNSQMVTYFRYKGNRRLVKRCSREDKVSFFKKPKKIQHSYSIANANPNLNFVVNAAALLDAACELGCYLMLMRTVDELAALPLPLALRRLSAPISVMQSRLFRSATGEPVAFMTWAWINIDTLEPGTCKGVESLTPAEWNEGSSLCICDAVTTPSGASQLTADLAGAWFPGEDLWLYPTMKNTTEMVPGTYSAVKLTPKERSLLNLENSMPVGQNVRRVLKSIKISSSI